MKMLILILILIFQTAVVQGVIITMTPLGMNTLGAASKIAKPGDIIEFESGIYNKTQYIQVLNGTAEQHIIIRAKAQSNVIFDGSTAFPLFWITNIKYVDMIGPFEIRNGKSNLEQGGNGVGHGLCVYHADHVTIKNFVIHHTRANCMSVSGWDVTISDNYLHDCVLMNYNGSNSIINPSWGQAMSTSYISSVESKLSERIIIENNIVKDVWGEGIDFIGCDNCIARHNIVLNAFSVLFYLDNAKNCLVEKNSLFCNSPWYKRGGAYPSAFLIGTESHGDISAVNITIRDNVGAGAGHCIAYYGEHLYYANLTFVHNTFANMHGYAIYMPACKTSGMTANNELSNNILSSMATNIDPTELSSWKIFSNVWYGPSRVLLDSVGNTSIFIQASTNPISSVFNTELTECYDAKCYRPKCYGTVLSFKGRHSNHASTTDFFENARNLDSPVIGFAEYCRTHIDEASGGNDGSKTTSMSSKLSIAFIYLIISFITTLN